MSQAGTSNPEYVNSRVRARRAALFGEEDYRKLVRMGTGEIARYMEETEYEAEMNALGARHRGVDLIEYALNENLAKHFEQLLDWAEGTLYTRIANYLRKFDAWNAKTAIRGVYSGSDAEEISTDYIRAGEFDDGLLDQMAAAGTVEEVVELLSETIFAEGLDAAYEEFDERDVLVPLENAIDKTFYEHLLDGIDTTMVDRNTPAGLYLDVLQAEIDFRNIRNALRLSRTGTDLDPEEYYIEGGKLFESGELRQLVGNFDEFVDYIRESTYGDELSGALADLDAAESLIQFEHALDSALLEYSDTLSYTYPVSICSALSYVLAKEREIENIRAIARGREVGLSPDEIEDELVVT
ncbi:V/A-type H+-transporting ATPase subunit C [Halovenus aranensis]|jgi:V/A-type H+-transporting ATPase subunit C|uniref:A-type ATP synthase subunit C n=1 Tax=Halovenus aranensis TaxID=890420 RepID=A0A1G8TI81_9EURY|nr:V-type ATP synthase subunit C [Halovenus aranensis]SDJ41316.1 V/A-type H+-transporting ATPase subunit C [Halovenus aranensis]